MSASHNARQMLSAEPLSSVDVAEILRATADTNGQFNPHVVRMAQEIERLQWDLQGWKGRCEMAREERDDIAGRYWRLQMAKTPGGPV